MATIIDDVKTLQIRNAKNGDFDLNLADETARNQIDDLTQDLGVQTARIDNLLTQGTPTEGNAELIDIRVGADGTIYPTAGNAVRGQVSDLKSDYTELDGRIDDLETFCKKEIVSTETGSISVTAGSQVPSSQHLVDVSIANGTEFTFKLEADERISKYHLYANGNAIKYNCVPETVYTLTAGADITYLSIFSNTTDVVGTGTITGIVTISTTTTNSLEERIDDLETSLAGVESDIDTIEGTIADVSNLIETNLLYDEATKVVSGEGTYVFEDILTLTDISVGDVFTFSIGSVSGNNSDTVGYIDTYDSSNTRVQRIALATNTTLTNSVTVASGEVKVIFILYPSFTGACTATYTNVKVYTGITEEHYLDPNFVWSDEIEDNVQAIVSDSVDSAIDSELFDYSMTGRYDPNDAEIDKYVNPNTGIVNSTTGYYTTDFMEIRTGETLYFFRKDTQEAREAGFYAGYDANKTFVSGSGGSNATSVSQSGNVKYIRASFAYQSAYYDRRPEGIFVVATSKPTYAPGTVTDPVLRYEKRADVYIYSTDTESQIITKLVNAYNRGNCDVHFERAHYTFGNALASVQTTYKLNSNEIPVGNNCRYYFNGATLEATIDLQTLGSDFYCNLMGCQRFPSSFEMYDGILIATDTRYVIHDEASAYGATYRHLYKNMVMQYITADSTDIYRKCIGGGTGKNGVIDIEGCKFITDGQEPDVSYHGNSTDVSGAEFNINIRNCWFSKTFAANMLSANQTARLFFSGNSTASAIVSYERWSITSFLNEVRT